MPRPRFGLAALEHSQLEEKKDEVEAFFKRYF
jgi:hypothetical protein